MATKMNEVQAEVYKLLTTDERLSSIITGLYDYVPETTKVPYVTIGEMTSESKKTKTDVSEQVTITLDTWSESKGRKESIRILSAIEEIMETDINLTDSYLLEQKISERSITEERYGLYHGTISLEFYIEWQ